MGRCGDGFTLTEQDNKYLEILRAVNPRHHSLCVARYIQKLPYKEIAAQSGLPEGTVKTGIMRAKNRIIKWRLQDQQEAVIQAGIREILAEQFGRPSLRPSTKHEIDTGELSQKEVKTNTKE